MLCLAQKKVNLCPESQSFVVEGSKGDKYAVTLAPKEVCQCPSVGTCYHILAAKMSVGLETKSEKMVYNMTLLTKNTRKKPNKYAGKKAPRPIDKLDANESVINPAPDSILHNAHFDDFSNFSKVTSTPACIKFAGDNFSPKTILKRKLESEIESASASKRLCLDPALSNKRLKLSLPKTRRRKSLIKTFSDISNADRETISELNECDLLQDDATILKNTSENKHDVGKTKSRGAQDPAEISKIETSKIEISNFKTEKKYNLYIR